MLEHEPIIRGTAFLSLLILMLVWEQLAPRRETLAPTWQRRLNNIALIVVASLIIRFLLPVLVLVEIAQYVSQANLGLLHLVELPFWLEVVLAYVILDMVIYWQHVFMHKIPILWRLHRVHHSDVDMDVTTGVRFHPIEIILSLSIKAVVVTISGAPLLAVLLFELSLNIFPMFNHANIKIPKNVDNFLRYIVVTPDMHRVHHSNQQKETDSNFGFSVPWWDYLFKSYCAQPQAGHEGMTVGLDDFKDKDTVNLHKLLQQPFIK